MTFCAVHYFERANGDARSWSMYFYYRIVYWEDSCLQFVLRNILKIEISVLQRPARDRSYRSYLQGGTSEPYSVT